MIKAKNQYDRKETSNIEGIFEKMKIETGAYYASYAYVIPQSTDHEGLIKVGMTEVQDYASKTIAEIKEDCGKPDEYGAYSSKTVEEASHKRIRNDLNTSGMNYELLWCAINIDDKGRTFRDYPVHETLILGGLPRFNPGSNSGLNAREWFKATLPDVRQAHKHISTGGKYVAVDANITLRREQEDCVKFLTDRLNNGGRVLVSAIMRFGKTLTTYFYVKNTMEQNKKVLILTHRPAVEHGWREDFAKVLAEFDYKFVSKMNNRDFTLDDSDKYVRFASMQDLRGSFGDYELGDAKKVATDAEIIEFLKNEDIFAEEYDLVVVDEAHEGTKTELASKVLEKLNSKREIHLSGTPYNINKDFDQRDIYVWNYTDEVKAKKRWENEHPELPNPYADLPELTILVNDLTRFFKDSKYKAEENFFNFTELFRLNENKELVHKSDVIKFLNILSSQQDDETFFPYQNRESVEKFAHTVWYLPPEIEVVNAVEELLKNHPAFMHFEIVNAAGSREKNPLLAVKNAVAGNKPSITLTAGKLTVGVTVPEWSGIFIMNGMTSAIAYTQAIFRVKSAGFLSNGQQKKNGYVFDFSQSRVLDVCDSIAQNMRSHDLASGIKKPKSYYMEEILSFLPVVSMNGWHFKRINSYEAMTVINKKYVSKVVNSGFEHSSLYNMTSINDALGNKTDEFVEMLEGLVKSVGRAKLNKNDNRVGLSESELADKQKHERKASTGDSDVDVDSTVDEEEKKKSKKEKDERAKFIATMRALSVRIPLVVAFCGEPVEDYITVDNFPHLIDDKSWEEFMPNGFSKSNWEYFKKFYDEEIFSLSCDDVRKSVKNAFAEESIRMRVFKIVEVIKKFKNPDKETVLTAWNVVNLHASKTIGGAVWTQIDEPANQINGREVGYNNWSTRVSNKTFQKSDVIESEGLLPEPLFEDSENFDWSNVDARVIDINSKSGVYPLYLAQSMFEDRVQAFKNKYNEEPSLAIQEFLWKSIVENNVFANCRTEYAKQMTGQILSLGFDKIESNISVVDIYEVNKAIKENVKGDAKKNADSFDKLWQVVFNPTSFDKVEDRVEKIMDYIGENKDRSFEEVREFVESLEPSTTMFDLVFSNPPYQVEMGRKRHQVYPEFYRIANIVGEVSSMIFPIGWQKSTGMGSGSGYHSTMREDHTIVMIDNYYEDNTDTIQIFPGIGTSGVNIILNNKAIDNQGLVKFHEYGIFVEEKDMSKVFYWSERTQGIFDSILEWMNDNGVDGMNERVPGRNPFGIPGSVFNPIDNRDPSVKTSKFNEDYVGIVNKKPNQQGREILYVEQNFKNDKEKASLKTQNIEKHKVCWNRNGPNALWRKNFYVEPGIGISDAYLCAFFDSKEHSEGFTTYFTTLFYRFGVTESATNWDACRAIHRHTPDLSTIKNPRTGMIGWDSDWTDEDLQELFKDYLTAEDWEYIKQTALDSDGGRQ